MERRMYLTLRLVDNLQPLFKMINESSSGDTLNTYEWKVFIDCDVLDQLEKSSDNKNISESIIKICLDKEKKTQSSYLSG